VYLSTIIGRKFTDTFSFVVLPFRNAIKYGNSNGRINSSEDLATYDINLVGFWPVLSGFTQIKCVQQTSISTRVSLSTFAKWQYGYVLLLLARGWPCDAKRADIR